MKHYHDRIGPCWYGDQLYRTVLEAQWAALFDKLDIMYDYLKESEIADDYIPDFYLFNEDPFESGFYVEISRDVPTLDFVIPARNYLQKGFSFLKIFVGEVSSCCSYAIFKDGRITYLEDNYLLVSSVLPEYVSGRCFHQAFESLR